MNNREHKVAAKTRDRSPYAARVARLAAAVGLDPKDYVDMRAGRKPYPDAPKPDDPPPKPKPFRADQANQLRPIDEAGIEAINAARAKRAQRNARRFENSQRQEAGKMK